MEKTKRGRLTVHLLVTHDGMNFGDDIVGAKVIVKNSQDYQTKKTTTKNGASFNLKHGKYNISINN